MSKFLETLGYTAGQSVINTISGLASAGLQRYWAIKDRDYANAYNHPKQQMQRLKEAGLNPNLVYGNGAAQSQTEPVRGTNIDIQPSNLANSLQAVIQKKLADENEKILRENARAMQLENDFWDLHSDLYERKKKMEVLKLENEAYSLAPDAFIGKEWENRLSEYNPETGEFLDNKEFRQLIYDSVREKLNSIKITNELQKKQKELSNVNIELLQRQIYQNDERFKVELQELITAGKIGKVRDKIVSYIHEKLGDIWEKLPTWIQGILSFSTLFLYTGKKMDLFNN